MIKLKLIKNFKYKNKTILHINYPMMNSVKYFIRNKKYFFILQKKKYVVQIFFQINQENLTQNALFPPSLAADCPY